MLILATSSHQVWDFTNSILDRGEGYVRSPHRGEVNHPFHVHLLIIALLNDAKKHGKQKEKISVEMRAFHTYVPPRRPPVMSYQLAQRLCCKLLSTSNLRKITLSSPAL